MRTHCTKILESRKWFISLYVMAFINWVMRIFVHLNGAYDTALHILEWATLGIMSMHAILGVRVASI